MKDLISNLSVKLSGRLPGENAHAEMAPIKRPMPDEARSWGDTRLSAVLVLLYPNLNDVNIALMLRPEYAGVHSRQVSFPGGRKEDVDPNMRATALREAKEELGIPAEKVKIIGELSELYIPPSKSLVTPVVGYLEERPEFIPDPKEVQEIIEADFNQIMSEDVFGKTEIIRANYSLREVPAIFYNSYTIWGATAMILNELKWIQNNR